MMAYDVRQELEEDEVFGLSLSFVCRASVNSSLMSLVLHLYFIVIVACGIALTI